jgi:hypothetical protein
VRGVPNFFFPNLKIASANINAIGCIYIDIDQYSLKKKRGRVRSSEIKQYYPVHQ